jgi:hypothetical protein
VVLSLKKQAQGQLHLYLTEIMLRTESKCNWLSVLSNGGFWYLLYCIFGFCYHSIS